MNRNTLPPFIYKDTVVRALLRVQARSWKQGLAVGFMLGVLAMWVVS